MFSVMLVAWTAVPKPSLAPEWMLRMYCHVFAWLLDVLKKWTPHSFIEKRGVPKEAKSFGFCLEAIHLAFSLYRGTL